jgi:outer membrane protein with beta-barrel domain
VAPGLISVQSFFHAFASVIRPLAVIVFLVTSASPQPLSFGLKVGIPLTSLVQADPTSAASATTNAYIAGGSIEFRLPRNLSLEFDVLYRHLHYSDSLYIPLLGGDFERVSAGTWEFPLLVKYCFRGNASHPFVSAGSAFDVVALRDRFVDLFGLGPPSVQTTTGTNSSSLALRNSLVAGLTAGTGVELPVGRFRISPEIRYTYWLSPNFYALGTFSDGKHQQVEFLLGFRF